MALLKALCWALIFIIRIATILRESDFVSRLLELLDSDMFAIPIVPNKLFLLLGSTRLLEFTRLEGFTITRIR